MDMYKSIEELDLSSDITKKYKGLMITCDDGTAEAFALKVVSASNETVTIDGSVGINSFIIPVMVIKLFSTSNGTTFPADLRCYGLN
jgi:hypothetical protein